MTIRASTSIYRFSLILFRPSKKRAHTAPLIGKNFPQQTCGFSNVGKNFSLSLVKTTSANMLNPIPLFPLHYYNFQIVPDRTFRKNPARQLSIEVALFFRVSPPMPNNFLPITYHTGKQPVKWLFLGNRNCNIVMSSGEK